MASINDFKCENDKCNFEIKVVVGGMDRVMSGYIQTRICRKCKDVDEHDADIGFMLPKEMNFSIYYAAGIKNGSSISTHSADNAHRANLKHLETSRIGFESLEEQRKATNDFKIRLEQYIKDNPEDKDTTQPSSFSNCIKKDIPISKPVIGRVKELIVKSRTATRSRAESSLRIISRLSPDFLESPEFLESLDEEEREAVNDFKFLLEQYNKDNLKDKDAAKKPNQSCRLCGSETDAWDRCCPHCNSPMTAHWCGFAD
jgi:hypothetical protein